MLKILLGVGLATTLAVSAHAAQTPAAQVEAAERAFAADGLALGVRDSFLKSMADDAILFAPGPVSAKALFEKRPSSKSPRLEWWPQRVVAARSGDLALSVGPSVINGKRGGYYATIWRREPNGGWKWIYDGGAAADASKAPGPEAPTRLDRPAAAGEPSPALAFDKVRTAESALAQTAEGDATAAYRRVLAADAWLLGPKGAEGLTPDALEERLASRPSRMTLALRGGGASQAGDFVWTWGEAHWADAQAKPQNAHHMHVWQKRPEGWRLILEALINDR
jgi:ketosteroid isomerase-like protein